MQINRAVMGAFILTLCAVLPGAAQDLSDRNIPAQGNATRNPILESNSNSDGTLLAANSGDASASPSALASSAAIVVAVPILETHKPDIAANPGRPSMATSALLTPFGYAQFENGILYAAGSAEFAHRAGMEETMRLTVARRLQLIVSAEPGASSQQSHRKSTQRGDTTGGLQVVAFQGAGPKPTIAFSYLRLVKGGGASSLDIGGSTNSALLLASLDLGRLHIDSNGFVNEVAGPVRRAQFGQATAMTLPLRLGLSATAELRYFTQPLTRGYGLSTLLAAGYTPRPNLVFDAGVARGLNDTSTRWQATGGFTYVLPHRTWGF